jgi:3',5'-cyclic AMP phosphodiesterase CpdA
MTKSVDNITTAILRFRDLVTGPGKTIEHHEKIAKAKKWVWWGWWNKYGETVADDVFRRLAKIAETGSGLRLILFDSGRLEVFSTICREIHWDTTRDKVPPPDYKHTPPYYRDNKYLTWFKLESFEKIDENELKNLSYIQVDEFFLEKKSRFEPFYGKQVSGTKELKQQDRTIWFVRPFKLGDHTHQIELLDAARISPADFPPDHITSKSRNLIWISDLHFGSEHGFPTQSDAEKYDLGQAIEYALTDNQMTDYAGLVVSGDITWKAAPEEFETARKFLQRIADSPSSLKNYDIIPCPGNHDLAFTDTPEDKSAGIHTAVASEDARKAYSDFYEGLFYKRPNEYISCGRRFLLGDCIPVEIISLNSSLLDQKENWFQGHGFIGDEQLRHAAEEMGWVNSCLPRAFRIVVLHHHLMPVTFRDTPIGGYPYSVVLDAEAVVQWLVKHRVDLVLHGHMHKAFIARVERPINVDFKSWHSFHVVGLSSTGVGKNHTDDKNAFAVLTFSESDLSLRWFTVDPKDKSQKQRDLQIPYTRSRP